MVECLVLAGAFDFAKAPRGSLKEAVEKVFRQAQTLQADSQRGQTSLFGMIPAESDDSLPEVPELPPGASFNGGKGSAGFLSFGPPSFRA